MSRYADRRTNIEAEGVREWMDIGQVDGWEVNSTGRWMDEQMEGWVDGWLDGQ